MPILIFIFLVLISPTQIKPSFIPLFVIWNVGQGQWLTAIENSKCVHFDVGGEWSKENKVKKICSHSDHILYLSHMDWDHISFLKKLRSVARTLCLRQESYDLIQNPKKLSRKKQTLFSMLEVCTQAQNSYVAKEVVFESREAFSDSNAQSHVFTYNKEIVIPGDSTQAAEKIWSQKLSTHPRILIAGHHGSKTSTSQFLLERLHHLKMVIASSRRVRYGHPHKEVAQRLLKQNLRILTTESWGDIAIEISKIN